MTLPRTVYATTEGFPKREMFGLTNQIRQAAVSVPSNIAEGRGRLSEKSFALFLGQARGSLYELQTQIELARDLNFVPTAQADGILAEATEIASMIHGLLSALRGK